MALRKRWGWPTGHPRWCRYTVGYGCVVCGRSMPAHRSRGCLWLPDILPRERIARLYDVPVDMFAATFELRLTAWQQRIFAVLYGEEVNDDRRYWRA